MEPGDRNLINEKKKRETKKGNTHQLSFKALSNLAEMSFTYKKTFQWETKGDGRIKGDTVTPFTKTRG